MPWPDARLSPNYRSRSHWPVTAAKKAARETASVMTTCAVPLRDKKALRASTDQIRMTITFVPPDRRHRDDDNMIASLKAARDGIADALGVNDRRFRPNYVFAEPEKPGRVEVEIIHIGTVDRSPSKATDGAESVMENANREGACNQFSATGWLGSPATGERSRGLW